MVDPKFMKFDTLSLHGGQQPDTATGARAVPIYQTVAYNFHDADHAASLFNLGVLPRQSLIDCARPRCLPLRMRPTLYPCFERGFRYPNVVPSLIPRQSVTRLWPETILT